MSPVGETAGEPHPQVRRDGPGAVPGPVPGAAPGASLELIPLCCVQIQGLGTALKILFSEKQIQKLPEHSPSKGFQLTRQEIVALINAFGR